MRLGRRALDTLGGLLDEARALLRVDAHVLAGVELRYDVTRPRRELVAPCADPEAVLADPVDDELAPPAIVAERFHPRRPPAAFLFAPVLEAHRQLSVAGGEHVGFDDDGPVDDPFGREATRADIRRDVLDGDRFEVGHPHVLQIGLPVRCTRHTRGTCGRVRR